MESTLTNGSDRNAKCPGEVADCKDHFTPIKLYIRRSETEIYFIIIITCHLDLHVKKEMGQDVAFRTKLLLSSEGKN